MSADDMDDDSDLDEDEDEYGYDYDPDEDAQYESEYDDRNHHDVYAYEEMEDRSVPEAYMDDDFEYEEPIPVSPEPEPRACMTPYRLIRGLHPEQIDMCQRYMD